MFTRGTAAGRGVRWRRTLLRAAAVACALAAGAGAAIALALSGPGGLDPSFGTGGTTVVEHETDTYPVEDALAGGEKLVVLSTSEPGRIVVERRLPDGSLDPSFDGDGEAVIAPKGFPGAHAVAVDPEGRILVAGYINVGEKQDAVVWRLNASGGSGAPNGDLDASFGDGGEVLLPEGAFDSASSLALQPDGRIVVAGSFNTGSGKNHVAVWRLTADGALDQSFAEEGFKDISDTAEDAANAVAVGLEGKIVVAGTTGLSSAPPDAVVWRLDANGSTDTTFDTDGQADIDTGGEDFAEAVAVQPDGRIVMAGYSRAASSPSRAMVWRLKVNGGDNLTNNALDPEFGGGTGTAELTGLGSAEGDALALQPDGKILVAGSTRSGSGPYLAALWRVTAAGGSGTANSGLDTSFAGAGLTTVADGEGAFVDSLALAPDHRVTAAGSDFKEHILLFRALGDPFTITVARAGSGSGSVSSQPAGIACGATCVSQFDNGSQITLSAQAAAGSVFAGWSGAGCSGTGTCVVAADSEQTITATFVPAAPGSSPGPSTVKLSLAGHLLRIGTLRRGARRLLVSLRGLPPGMKVKGALLAGHSSLARASATVSAAGKAVLRFVFGKAARRRLHSRRLHTLTLRLTAALGGRQAPVLERTIKLVR